MEMAAPTYSGLDQNYDFIYEALLEGATVYLRIARSSGITYNALVVGWELDPSYGLTLEAIIDGTTTYFEFTTGSYHTTN